MQKIIGLKPLTSKNIEYFLSDTTDRIEAERLAAYEFLEHFLKMDEDEVKELVITKTNILYLEMSLTCSEWELKPGTRHFHL